MEAQVNAVWYADGALLWAQPNGVLLGATFDPRRRRLTGAPVSLVEGVRLAVGGPAQVAVSATGSMVYVPEQPFSLMEMDRNGRRDVLADGYRFHSPRYSPDGRRVAVDFPHQGSRDVWTVDLRRRNLSRLSFENDGHDPIWSPDGRWITYIHNSGIWRRRADGGGTPESLFVRTALTGGLEYSPDGRVLLTSPTGNNGSFDLGILTLEGEREQSLLLGTPFNEQAATLSPNGRWMAYSSDETGRDEVYVRPFPEGDAKTLVSMDGGSEPRWSPDGRTIYYQSLRNGVPMLIAAEVTPGPEFQVGAQTPLFDVSEFEPASPHANYDVSPDGTRFVMVYQGPLSEMVFVLNWAEEIRRRSVGSAR
jgi:dipeptidyl aminopeptidase/acylaminoacyl peptidase